MQRALVLRHKSYEDIAGFGPPIRAAGYAIATHDVPERGLAGVDLAAPDLLVVMGGPMAAYETDRHPWIAGEVAGLAARIASGRPTIGICLGSQLIAAALGARVHPGPTKEVGFAPVALTAAGRAGPLRHLDGIALLHWHGDTFELPPGTELLASTLLYRHQAFARGRALLALQFHAEMGTDPAIEQWIAADAAMIAAAGTDGAAVRADQARVGARTVAAGQAMLAEWLAALG